MKRIKRILCICAAVWTFCAGGAALAGGLDTAEVTELRIATTDCAYALRPMGELAEEVCAGDTVYVIRAEQVEGYAGMTEYVLCNTDGGLRWLWGGFTGYKVNAEGREGPLGDDAPDGAEPTGNGGTFTITTYCPCEECNSGYSGTATGTQVTPGRTVAVDPAVIPLGTHIYIDDVGWRVAEDTGGRIKGNIIDLAVSGHGEFDKFCALVRW